MCEKSCPACPFNFFSEESEQAQNYGCLPAPLDIIEDQKSTNKNWACHDTKKICRGMIQYSKRKGIEVDLTKGLLFEVGVHGSIRNDLLNKL